MQLQTRRMILRIQTTFPSSRAAEKIGMTVKKQITFRGFPAQVFSLSPDRWLALSGV